MAIQRETTVQTPVQVPASHERRHDGIRGAIRRFAMVLLAGGGLACSLADDAQLPSDVQDPTSLRTAAGAMGRYFGVLLLWPVVIDQFLTKTGILTDELVNLPTPDGGLNGQFTPVDSRIYSVSDFENDYQRLHKMRGEARDARGHLQAYAPDSSPAFAGHMAAIEGYAEVLLADLFCSGIPLSTLDFEADYTLAAGSTTEEVYRHAIELFDTALALTGDSSRFQHFAAIGRGRALAALGEYADAAAAVAAVPDNYAYKVMAGGNYVGGAPRLLWRFFNEASFTTAPTIPVVGDNEGVNGLNYRSSGDPRTLAMPFGVNQFGHMRFAAAKYPTLMLLGEITVADGIEARLIEAEAALNAGNYDAWLAKLNHLRQTAWSTIQDCSFFGCFPATTGPLSDLTDPGVDGAGTNALRVDLLFRERAFWLYLTGHRQGDLRRLVRVYRRNPSLVYPSGLYREGTEGVDAFRLYGPKIVAEPAEFNNPLYTGCFHFDA